MTTVMQQHSVYKVLPGGFHAAEDQLGISQTKLVTYLLGIYTIFLQTYP